VLVTLVTWCAAYSKWSTVNWSLPVRYLEPESADFIGTCALLKTVVTDNWLPLGTRRATSLGAPAGADWGSSPTTDEIEVAVVSLLIRVWGLFPGFNLGLLLGHLSAAAVCYAVARSIGVESRWAFVAALAFGLAPWPLHP
jgi:hypothetical protein